MCKKHKTTHKYSDLTLPCKNLSFRFDLRLFALYVIIIESSDVDVQKALNDCSYRKVGRYQVPTSVALSTQRLHVRKYCCATVRLD